MPLVPQDVLCSIPGDLRHTWRSAGSPCSRRPPLGRFYHHAIFDTCLRTAQSCWGYPVDRSAILHLPCNLHHRELAKDPHPVVQKNVFRASVTGSQRVAARSPMLVERSNATGSVTGANRDSDDAASRASKTTALFIAGSSTASSVGSSAAGAAWLEQYAARPCGFMGEKHRNARRSRARRDTAWPLRMEFQREKRGDACGSTASRDTRGPHPLLKSASHRLMSLTRVGWCQPRAFANPTRVYRNLDAHSAS